MSKILITGMSAPQASRRLGARTTSFAALLDAALKTVGHEVTWAPASVDWTEKDLEQYDLALVGLAPLTSLSANYAYGALNVVDLLKDGDRLALFFDAPQPRQLLVALKAVTVDDQTLVKPFYRARKEYQKVLDPTVAERLLRAARWLLEARSWPVTLYPVLPWRQDYEVAAVLPTGARESLVPVNLDAFVTQPTVQVGVQERLHWSIDQLNTDWARSTASTLVLPSKPMRLHKGWTDKEVYEQLLRSVGAVITPHKPGGTWWSPRYVQALYTRTPVATDWRESASLGGAWNVLAASIEAMNPEARTALATEQLSAYLNNIPTAAEATQRLQTALGLDYEERQND